MLDRGEVWLASLDPRRGTEPGKTRPVLVVQAQALLDAWPEARAKFVKVFPKEYRRALGELAAHRKAAA